jgi:hypothetical protein
LSGTLGVVEGRCTASPGTADGDALISDAQITLDLAGQKLVLADLKPHPDPNTHVPVELDRAAGAITAALKTQLTNMLAAPGAGNGPLAPLATAVTAVQTQVIDAVVANTRAQLLKPIGDQVLDLTLNKQSRPTPDSIRVSAIDLQVVPAAKDQLGASLASAQIGNVVCGPSGRAAAPAAAAPAAPKAAPKLPTAVSAGYGDMPAKYAGQDDGHTADVILAAFAVLVATGAGAVTFRRLRR